MKGEFYSPNSIQDLPKYLRFNWPMVQFMLANREMGLDKDQVKLHT
jgi:hypothetical protein